LPSKNMMSDFAQEVAKYSKSSYFGSVQAYCFTPLVMQPVVYVTAYLSEESGCHLSDQF